MKVIACEAVEKEARSNARRNNGGGSLSGFHHVESFMVETNNYVIAIRSPCLGYWICVGRVLVALGSSHSIIAFNPFPCSNQSIFDAVVSVSTKYINVAKSSPLIMSVVVMKSIVCDGARMRRFEKVRGRLVQARSV